MPPPRCGRCGSGTGVLGDIGQGSAAARRRRGYAPAGGEADQIQFECLRCGDMTLICVEPVRPRCRNCGSRDGVLVESDA